MKRIVGRKVMTLSILLLTSIVCFVLSCIFLPNTYLGIGLGVLTVGLLLLQFRAIMREIRYTNVLAEAVSKGNWPKIPVEKSNLTIVEKLRVVHDKMHEVIAFVNFIGDESFKFQHLGADDPIGQSLLTLKANQQEHIKEENQRHWKTEGLAKFAEILRTNDQDLKALSQKVLSHLVRYLDANQGGFFIEENDNDERYMQLTACYAYDRKKFVEQRVEAGQGLLGQVMLEKDIIYMTDIPAEFVKITSGLGESTPTNIAIVPLMVNEEFYGAIELASFYLFEDHHLDFLREVTVNIASAIATMKVNENTKKLLEESQTLTTELGAAEEEMRQNMEELQATQEEMNRKQAEIDGLFGAINTTQVLIEFDLQGNLLNANDKILELLNCKREEFKKIAGQFHGNNGVLERVRNGEHDTKEVCIQSQPDMETWLNINYSPVKNTAGEVCKILILAQDITEKKRKEKEFETLSLVADNTDNSVVITNKSGQIEYVNRGFTDLTGYTLEEVRNKKPGSILQGPETDQSTIERIRQNLEEDQPIFEEILNYKRNGSTYWISMAINPVKDKEGEVYKYISIQADITDTKIKTLDYKNKLEAIDRSNAIVEFDMEANILNVNNNFLKIVKYQEDEVLNKHHRIFMKPGEEESEDYKAFWRMLKKGEFVIREFKRVNRAGKEIWLRGIYNPILDINGQPIKVIKYATDITKEKQLSIETENQRRELATHLETINKTIATIEFGPDAKIISANNVYLDISGYSQEDLIGKKYNFLLPEEELGKPQNKMMWDSLLDGHYFTGQFRQKSTNGSDLWLLGTFNPVFTESGELESIKMFAQFNTLEKEKEINMGQMLSAFRSIVPVIELNVEGKCTKANNIFHDQFGLSKIELRKKTVANLFDVKFTKKQLDGIFKKLNQGEVTEELISCVSKNGGTKILRAIFNPIRTQSKELDKILLILMDKEMVVNVSA